MSACCSPWPVVYPKPLISRAEMDQWLGEQASLHPSGDFFQVWVLVLSSGTV